MKDYNALLRTWKEARDIVYNVINCPSRSSARCAARRSAPAWSPVSSPTCRSRPRRRKIIDGHTRPRASPRAITRVIVYHCCGMAKAKVLPAAVRGGRRRGGGAHRAGLVVVSKIPARSQRARGSRHQARRRCPDLDPLSPSTRSTIGAHDGPVLRRLDGARNAGLLGPEVKEGLASHLEKRKPKFDPYSPI